MDTAQADGGRAGRCDGGISAGRRPRLYSGGAGQPRGRAWRVRRHRRPDRLREIDAAQCRRRACSSRPPERCRIFDAPLTGPQPRCRLSVSGRRAVSLEDRDRQRRDRPRDRGRAAPQALAARAGLARRRSASARSPTAIRICCRAASASASALAQVLIRDPKILLMDEPFGPLDAQTRQIMGNLLLELWSADRKAVLFVTHDLEEAIALADRVVIMSAGPGRAHHRRLAGAAAAPARHLGSADGKGISRAAS